MAHTYRFNPEDEYSTEPNRERKADRLFRRNRRTQRTTVVETTEGAGYEQRG